jgi:putative transposase
MSNKEKRLLIEPGHPSLSIAEQCDVLGLARSSYYYEAADESAENLLYMRLMDEYYLRHPDFGYRRMHIELKRAGHHVNEKRVLRLMQLMGIQSILPKKNLSIANKEHKKYPYLLNGLWIYKPLQVFAIDITYIPMSNGFIYLTAIIDLYSRYVMGWEISNSLDVIFCLEALKSVLKKFGCPEIFNMDQGSQFTCDDFLKILIAHGIQISMDGKGRAIDNIFIERFWWSLKYEMVYPSHWKTVPEAIQGIGNYIEYYGKERSHQSLDYATPYEIFTGKLVKGFGENHKGFFTRTR